MVRKPIVPSLLFAFDVEPVRALWRVFGVKITYALFVLITYEIKHHYTQLLLKTCYSVRNDF